MSNIKCPHYGTIFTINETECSQLLVQVRSSEFGREVHDRLEEEKALLEEKSRNDLQARASAKDKEISELATQLEQLKQTLALENQRLLSQKEREITELKAQLESLSSVKELELSQTLFREDKELVEVQNRLERLSLENKNSLVEAVTAVEKKRDDTKSELALQEEKAELSLASAKNDYEAQLKTANE